jgi:hypothetical protein
MKRQARKQDYTHYVADFNLTDPKGITGFVDSMPFGESPLGNPKTMARPMLYSDFAEQPH